MMRLLGDPRTFDVDNDELIALCAAMDVQTMLSGNATLVAAFPSTPML